MADGEEEEATCIVVGAVTQETRVPDMNEMLARVTALATSPEKDEEWLQYASKEVKDILGLDGTEDMSWLKALMSPPKAE